MIATHKLQETEIPARNYTVFHAQQPIIIVDDDSDDRALLSLCLRSFLPSHKPVITLKGGAELLRHLDALEMENLEADEFAVEMPAMIFLDLLMPGMNGIETLEAIRRQPLWIDTPVTLITGSRDDKAIQQAEKAGANAFLPKPFSKLDVINVLHRGGHFSSIL